MLRVIKKTLGVRSQVTSSTFFCVKFVSLLFSRKFFV